jgi:cell division protein FtsI/penicillin-binding protein 2
MTRRGRLTLAAAGAVVLLLVGWMIRPMSAVRAALPEPPAVASAPQDPPHRPEPGATPPAELLRRLPVSRAALELPATGPGDVSAPGRLYETIPVRELSTRLRGPLRVEYTLDAELMQDVFGILKRGRVSLGNVVVMDPRSGRVLAYAATDLDRFPPTRSYPAASLVKIITAAAALDRAPDAARLPCRYRGSPYRLTDSRIDPPAHGNTVSLRRALATSNNQCFAQLAVHALGVEPLLEAINRFGWLAPPAPAHAAGSAEAGEERLDVGRLGCGLAGSRITPLHAAQLASTLAHGELVAPRWIERVVDGDGRALAVPESGLPRRVLSPKLTAELRDMLVDTTRSGTARRAFRGRSGRSVLGSVTVAGKTGSLSGKAPDGRYEWFVGVAPADDPRIAVATVLVQDHLWWRNASQVSADVLRAVFCSRRGCSAENAERFTQPGSRVALAREPDGPTLD